DQIRRYHNETPELFVPEQIFTATEAIGFSYGVTWNTVRRNIFNWKAVEPRNTPNTRKVENQRKQDSAAASDSVYSVCSVVNNDSGIGNLEAKVKSFCAIPQVLAFLKEFIVFAEKDEELNKYILRQHQTGAVEKVVGRALERRLSRGLVWHTQGSGK